MSANKLRYYEVTTVATVAANNKGDAEAIARGRRGITGRTLATETTVERISAVEARQATV